MMKLKKITLFDLILVILMILVCVVTLYPFLHVLALSFNDATDAVRGGIHIFPREFTLDNYQHIFSTNSALPRAFFNSVLRTVIGTATGVMSCAILAYTLSRKKFMFRKSISMLLVFTMYISGGLIPEFLLIRNLGLVNNFAVYIIPSLISAFNVIVIRSFMESLPDALEESAKMDGANDFTIFLKIILPLCLPVIATVALFVAVGQWNSWFDTYLYARNNDGLTTLQFELMKILEDANISAAQINNPVSAQQVANRISPTSIRMAITIVATVPILLVYPFLQKYFVTGLTIGAVKS